MASVVPVSPGRHRTLCIIGLSGGVGCGKSTVAHALERLGLPLIDADQLAHQALKLPQVCSAVTLRFGKGVTAGGGSIDRTALARIAFADPSALRFLERLIHPIVGREIRQRLAAIRQTHCHLAVVLDVPLLFESGLDRLCTAVVFIQSRRSDREQRTMLTRGWSREAVRHRERCQVTLAEKRRLAGYRLDNRGPITELPQRVARLLHRILRTTARPGAALAASSPRS